MRKVKVLAWGVFAGFAAFCFGAGVADVIAWFLGK